MSLTLRACQAVLLESLLALCVCSVVQAQEKLVDNALPQTSNSSSASQSTVIPPPPSIDDDPNWHFTSLSYLWFPGVHGIVGAKGYSTKVDVSPADELKHFNIGLMGSFEPQYKRWSLPLDFVGAKLSDTKHIIRFPDYSAKTNVKECIFRQKVNYVVLDGKAVKIRASAGVRGWYVGE